MKGLLCKDFVLLKKQIKIFLVMLLVFVALESFGELDSSFLMGYLPFIFSTYLISSISYDEFNNGLSFLLVLPVSRKGYVVEKYIFGGCLAVLGCLSALLLTTVFKLKAVGAAGMLPLFLEEAFGMGIIFFGIAIFISIQLPVQLKFGSEKGRMILFGVVFGIFGVGYVLFKALQSVVDFKKIAEYLNHAEGWAVLTTAAAVTVVSLLISYGCSLRIMEKKEL